MTLAILIVNWNRRADLQRLLGDLSLQTRLPDEVIIVDNGSSDGAPEMVARHYPQVRLIRLAENRGLSAGRNAGLAVCTTDLVAIMDNDLRVLDAEFVAKLCRSAEDHSDCGVISFCCFNGLWTPPPSNLSPPAVTMDELIALANRGANPVPPQTRYDWFFWGGACVIRQSVLKDVGLFDDLFRYGGEEWDFAYRCHVAGVRLLHDDGLWVVHVRSPVARHATANLLLLENMIVAQGRYLPFMDLTVFLVLQLTKSFFDSVRSGTVSEFFKTLLSLRSRWRQHVSRRRRAVSADTMRLVYSLRLRQAEDFETALSSRGTWLRFYAARAWRHLRGQQERTLYVRMV